LPQTINTNYPFILKAKITQRTVVLNTNHIEIEGTQLMREMTNIDQVLT